MTKEVKQLCKGFLDYIVCFNRYAFFTKKLWKKVKGFENADEAEVKCIFIYNWLHKQFGYFVGPSASSWFSEFDIEHYNNYMKQHKPIIEAFEKWTEEQR